MKENDLLAAVKSRIDIVDVVSEYVELRRSGQNLKGLCPFHGEKTPSFMVNPEKQIFHCFGCGAGGDSLAFVMRQENLSFPETLNLLARKAGLDPAQYRTGRSHESPKARLAEVLKASGEIFAKNLSESRFALDYLRNRRLDDETIRAFGLGYAPKDWHALLRALRQRGFTDSLILQAGVVAAGDKGPYDIFRERIIFPIADQQGEVIAFGGRVMDSSQPKYLNSPETQLFRKGETLYGMHLAKNHIKEKGYAVLVEGYFDVIVARQFGFRNVVAPLGTALTPGHLQRLRRFTKKAVLVFDGDEAGKAAARRSLPVLLEQEFQAKVLLLPEKDDPDSFLLREGEKAFAQRLGRAKSPVDFLLSAGKGDRSERVSEVLEMIGGLHDRVTQEELLAEVAKQTGIRETALRERTGRRTRRFGDETARNVAPAQKPRGTFTYDEEVLLVSALLSFPDQMARVSAAVPLDLIKSGVIRGIIEKLGSARGAGVQGIMELLDEDERAVVTRLAVDPGFDREEVEACISDCVKVIMSRKRQALSREVHERIKEAESAGEQELLDTLLPERQRQIKETP